MLHLQIVQDGGFTQRKLSRQLDNFIDSEFGDLLVRLNQLSFLYTFESCWGHNQFYGDMEVYSCLEGFMNFGLEANEQGREFLEKVKGVIHGNRDFTHLADSYPFHRTNSHFKPNEFHFGLMPMNGLSVQELNEGARFSSESEASSFIKRKKQIWNEWVEIVNSYEGH